MIAPDMARLSREIAALHGKRAALIADLTRGGKELNASMTEFCTNLAQTRSEMAKRTKSERMAFMQHLKDTVNSQRRGVAQDLAEVRRSWSGSAH
jgi:hypothetical protein